jgi:hypothetical protein
MSKEDEKVAALISDSCRKTFQEIEAISLMFERMKLGYRHSPYLVFVAS